MSAYEVSAEHIRYLVELGRELQIRWVFVDGGPRSLDLATSEDRLFIGQELHSANQRSISAEVQATPYFVDRPNRSGIARIGTLFDAVQALQWVRAYSYQSSRSSTWRESTARRYVGQLQDGLEIRIIGFFKTRPDFPCPSESGEA